MQLDSDDLVVIAEALERNFTTEELESSGYLDRQPDAVVRRELADLDFMFFCQFYLRHHFYLPPAPIHRELATYIGEVLEQPSETNEAMAWPRGYSKSTFVSLGLPLYCVMPDNPRARYILLIADSHDQAKGYLSTVKEELEHNDRLLEDYGLRQGAKWQSDHIETINRACIEALGRGMKIRGRKFQQWRPEVIVCDDLEEIERAQSSANREADAEWLARSVMKAGAPDRKLWVIGTVVHYDSVLSRLLVNPLFHHRRYKAVLKWSPRQDLWDAWTQLLTNLADPDRLDTARAYFKTQEAEMLEDTETAWPERYSYYDLMVMKVTGEGITEGSSFDMELQNEPIDPSKRYFQHIGRFTQEWRQGVAGEPGDIWLVPASGRPAVPLSACTLFGATDPSLGEKTSARTDPCAIIVLAKAPTGQMFVVENTIEWLTPDRIIAAQNELGMRHTFQDFGVEAVQFQALFASDAARASAEAGTYLPITPVKQIANKQLRIQSMQPDLQNEYILLPAHGAEKLIEQLELFPFAGHDDGPDALEIARRIAKQWQGAAFSTTVQTAGYTFGQEHTTPHGRTPRPGPYDEYEQLANQMQMEAAVVKELQAAERRAERELAEEESARPGQWPWYPRIQ